ncbi:MAG: hypothetical protein ACKVT0_16490 [Planctomycetaceae bacterium]
MNRCYLPGMVSCCPQDTSATHGHGSTDTIPYESSPTYEAPQRLEKEPLPPESPSRPMGPQLPGETFTDPQPEPFPAEIAPNAEGNSEPALPSDGATPEPNLQNEPLPPSEIPSDGPPSAVPNGLQSSSAHPGDHSGSHASDPQPGFFQKLRGAIPRIEPKQSGIASTMNPNRQRVLASRSHQHPSRTAATAPIPDPISSVQRPYRKPSTAIMNHNYPYSSRPAADTITIKARKQNPPDETEFSELPENNHHPRGVSYEEAVADYLKRPADFEVHSPPEEDAVEEGSHFEFDFATPQKTVIEPEQWPHSPR